MTGLFVGTAALGCPSKVEPLLRDDCTTEFVDR
jgi:hypothetical protein